MESDSGRTARLARIFFGWSAVAATLVLLLGYGREIAILSGISADAVGGRLFNLNGERNVPAWFSVLMLLGVAAAMLRATYVEFRLHRITAWGWLVLGLGFIYLAIDEQGGTFHERMGRALPEGEGIFYFRWVMIAIPGIIVLALAFIPFLRRIERNTAVRLIVAGAIFVLGSVGGEMVGGYIVSHNLGNIPLAVEICLEETLELTGALLALRCMLLHLEQLREPMPTQARHRDTSGPLRS